MTVRSVLDVDVQTASWERFQKQWDAYSETLRKQPEIWRKINEQHTKLADGFASFGNKLDAHFSAVHDLKDEQEANEKSLEHSGSLWSGIEKSSGQTAKHVISATTSLLKWTGLLSGVTGLLGYLTLGGIMDLGSDVFGYRKQAMGLGTTIGQSRAFDIAFGRLLGSPQGFLGGISTAVSNVAAQGPLYALGVNPNASTSHVAVATLEALRSRVRNTPVDQLGILEQMYKLGNLGISVDDLRRLRKMGTPEFDQLLGTYRTQQKTLNLNDRTAKAWTDFITKMEAAKGLIENVFVKDLVNLSGPLSNLTSSFAGLLSKIGEKNGPLAKGIDDLASWINRFSADMKTPGFISGLEKFIEVVAGIPAAGKALYHASGADLVVGGAKKVVGAAGYAYGAIASRWDDWASFWKHPSESYDIEQRGKWLRAANRMDPTGLLGLVGWLESGMNPNAPNSSKGAEGMMQIMPGVAKAFGIDPHNPEQALRGANEELGQLYREYHGNILKMLAAYNWGEGNLNRDIGRYGNDWQQHLPAETTNYLTRAIKAILAGAIKVDIQNNTGGSAAAAVSGLGAAR